MRHIIAGFIVVTGALIALPAHAQPEPIKAAREAVIESISKLDELKKNETIDPIEKLKQETDLKREALLNIVTLSTLETENISEKLSTLDVDIAFEDFREELVEMTEGYIEYFDAERQLLRRTEDLDGIQTIAGQIKDWRVLTYDPGIVKAVDLILVFQNREALEVADQRFEKLSIELKRRAAKIRQSWQPILLRASNDLGEAHRLNDTAVEMLTDYLPKTDLETSEETGTETEVIEAVDAKSELTTTIVRDLVEQSITKVKEAYGKFISLSDFLKR